MTIQKKKSQLCSGVCALFPSLHYFLLQLLCVSPISRTGHLCSPETVVGEFKPTLLKTARSLSFDVTLLNPTVATALGLLVPSGSNLPFSALNPTFAQAASLRADHPAPIPTLSTIKLLLTARPSSNALSSSRPAPAPLTIHHTYVHGPFQLHSWLLTSSFPPRK